MGLVQFWALMFHPPFPWQHPNDLITIIIIFNQHILHRQLPRLLKGNGSLIYSTYDHKYIAVGLAVNGKMKRCSFKVLIMEMFHRKKKEVEHMQKMM